ncbi:MAG: AAA family ATPase [Lachnospiraceae bacterium]|nr:AAA family ATPase [Lachnospiraceae bacterium]
MGILVCGLNGAGKSTLGKQLAERLSYTFIDNEDLYFPKTDERYTFSDPRNDEEVIRLLEERITADRPYLPHHSHRQYAACRKERRVSADTIARITRIAGSALHPEEHL